MKKLAILALAFSFTGIASANPPFTKIFVEKYKIEPTSNLGKAACLVCHVKVKGGKLNLYGTDVKAALKAKDTKKLTPAILASVESLDSTKSGKKNIEKIKADVNPGVK